MFPDGFLEDGGGIGGFLPIGGAGFGFEGVDPVEEIEDTEDRRLFLNCPTLGTAGATPGGGGGAEPGSLGAGGARVVSGSDR
jgi:hypothetical protein